MSSLSCGTLYSTITFLSLLRPSKSFRRLDGVGHIRSVATLLCIKLRRARTRTECWGFGERVIPDPFPNSAVTPLC